MLLVISVEHILLQGYRNVAESRRDRVNVIECVEVVNSDLNLLSCMVFWHFCFNIIFSLNFYEVFL